LISALLNLIRVGERLIATTAFLLMILVAFSDVALREITGSGLDGAREAAVLLMVVLVMSGFGLASDAGRHLRPRFADGLIAATTSPWVGRIGDLLSAAIFTLLAVLAAALVRESWLLGEVTPVLRLPTWLVQLFLPLAFGLAALRHTGYLARPELRPVEGGDLAAGVIDSKDQPG